MTQNRILRSLATLGSANVVSAGLSVLRMKAMALLLGPTGVGLFGLFNNFVALFVGLLSGGINHGAVRRMASAKGQAEEISHIRWTLFGSFLLQGLVGGMILWLCRDWLAQVLLDDTSQAGNVGLLAVAVFLTLLGLSQSSTLIGYRALGFVATSTVTISALGLVGGLFAAWVLNAGALGFVLAQAVATCVVPALLVWRLRRPLDAPPPLRDFALRWGELVRFGLFLALTELVIVFAVLGVRVLIVREISLEAAGFFAAAWAVGLLGFGIFSSAMATDFFPRLSEIITDRPAAQSLISEQLFFSIALGGPLMIFMAGWANWGIPLVYSAEFEPAVPLLKLFALAYLIRVAIWPLNSALNAAGRSDVTMVLTLLGNGVFLGLAWLWLMDWGLVATVWAFVAGQVVLLALSYTVLIRVVGYSPPLWLGALWAANMAATLCLALIPFSTLASTVLALALAPALAAIAFRMRPAEF